MQVGGPWVIPPENARGKRLLCLQLEAAGTFDVLRSQVGDTEIGNRGWTGSRSGQVRMRVDAVGQ